MAIGQSNSRKKIAKRAFFRNFMQVTTMQNAHIHLHSDKAIHPTIPFDGTVPRCACNVTELSLLHTNYPPPFTSRIISNLFYKTGLTIVSVGLFLLFPHARCLSVASRAFFVVASGFVRCLLSLLRVGVHIHLSISRYLSESGFSGLER